MAKSNFWTKIEAKMEAGEMPRVFINAAGRVCLDNGSNGAEFPARLLGKLPPEVIEQANAKAAERAAEVQARIDAAREAEAARKAKMETLRHRRCWVLGRLYMEDQTVQRYTLQELEDWRNWARYFRYKHPTVTITAFTEDWQQIVCEDWSVWFQETCGERCPSSENMAELAADLARFTNERRAYHAANN